MYDDHKLTASETYFLVNQLLRVFEEWINNLESDLQRLRQEIAEKMSPVVGHDPRRIIESNWAMLLKKASTSCSELKTRTKRKRDEIESLRDGVCTLQSPKNKPSAYQTKRQL